MKFAKPSWLAWAIGAFALVTILELMSLVVQWHTALGDKISWAWTHALEWVPTAFEILAFVVAFWAAWQAVRHANRLGAVTQSLSTRFVGAFPDHLDEITKKINGAEKSIEILADCVDYGSFRPDAHERLLKAHFMALAKGTIPLTILIWGEPQAMSRANKYRDPAQRQNLAFRKSARRLLSALRADQNFDKELPELLSACAQSSSDFERDPAKVRECVQKKEFKNLAALKAVQLCLHERVMRKMVGHDAHVVCYSDPHLDPDMFFWIIDRKEVLFALPSKGKDAPLFYTSDRQVVVALVGIFDQKLATAEEELAKRQGIIGTSPAT